MDKSKIRTVLIVEDQASMSEALNLVLSKEYNVLVANDGEEGLNLALKKKPDLILLDIMMPKMDGLTVAAKIKEDKWGADAKIIMLTNVSDPLHVAEAAKVGVFDFLVKTDWKLEDVFNVVKSKIDNIPNESDE